MDSEPLEVAGFSNEPGAGTPTAERVRLLLDGLAVAARTWGVGEVDGVAGEAAGADPAGLSLQPVTTRIAATTVAAAVRRVTSRVTATQ